MDLVAGKGTTCLQVLTERVTRKELIFKIPNKKQQTIAQILDRLEMNYKEAFYTMFKSITMDSGTEFIDQKALEYSCLKAGKKGQSVIMLTPTAHRKGAVMKMRIALLDALSRRVQTLLSTVNSRSKILNAG